MSACPMCEYVFMCGDWNFACPPSSPQVRQPRGLEAARVGHRIAGEPSFGDFRKEDDWSLSQFVRLLVELTCLAGVATSLVGLFSLLRVVICYDCSDC